MATKYALVGDPCLADGHPTQCEEPADGTIEDADSKQPLTLDGTPVADHGDDMAYPTHAHAYSSSKGCYDDQSHALTPDQTPPWEVDGRPLIQVGDSTTDPGSGGTAWVDSTSQTAFEVVD